MSDEQRTRRTSSSMQLSANARRLEEFRDALRAWLADQTARGQIDLAPVKADELVRFATLRGSDMCTDSFRDGIAVGEARERLKHAQEQSTGGE